MKNVLKIDLKRPRSWRDQASNLDDWRRWDRDLRRRCGWLAGLRFWEKTNTDDPRVLVSRHWPHRLCWSWSVWCGVRRRDMDGPGRFLLIVDRPYRFWEIQLWRVYVRASWQDYDWMPTTSAKSTAPTIYWKHHLEHAAPAGTA